ncbi:MAG TPA: twin-arginine translocation signal domain-containing protein, partial [Syntrophorhabdaceae bacterium]|nr:twin-arginine translocation signal domain-containing protein [Syntrophorhabdaceae bacterium]HRR72693.1 twin-arginine translocation signal domain-containing protein [Syntrophorhabdaceae bacterium]
MCEFCEDQSRRNFLKALLVGGAAAGVGMLDPKILLAQTTQIKFSTWHPPVGKEVKTVWIPML